MLYKFATAALLFLLPVSAMAEPKPINNDLGFLDPFPAYQVIGNIYYVGSRGLSAFLITTPEGNILINSGYQDNVPQIKRSIAALGFKYSDTKILLISHAHTDHVAGSDQIIRETHARYEVMDADVPAIESGGRADPNRGNVDRALYPPAKVDRILHDGDTVSLGGTVLTAHKTAGHTKGCTTWTLKSSGESRALDVAIVGSAQVNSSYMLIGNKRYPDIARDYVKTFEVLKSLPVDIFLGAHGAYYGMEAKYANLKRGGPNPFIDANGYKTYVMSREVAFHRELTRQQAVASGKASMTSPCLRRCGD